MLKKVCNINVGDLYHPTHNQPTNLSANDTRPPSSITHFYTSVFFFQSHICCDVSSMTPCTNIKTLVHLVTVGVAVLGKHVGVIEDELHLMREKIFEMYFLT